MSSSTRRQQQERDNEYSSSNTQQQHEATIRSIDMTKDNIRRSIEEVGRETPRYSQTVTDFQNETANASMDIANNFLESQKDVINSMQSVWAPMAERIGEVARYWTTTGMMPFFSPREMANIYARSIGAMTEAYVASTRMATNMMFAGLEAARATTNYTRQNTKEAARITSNTARAFAQTSRETVQVQGEERGGSASGGSTSFGAGTGSAAGSFESRLGSAPTTTATLGSEGTTVASTSGTGSTSTAGMGAAKETTTGVTEKTGKK
jgi:hypothetical protein